MTTCKATFRVSIKEGVRGTAAAASLQQVRVGGDESPAFAIHDVRGLEATIKGTAPISAVNVGG
jgi:hypothetical protein